MGTSNHDTAEQSASKEILKAIADEKSRGKKIVFTNGCFDILHIGHLRYLFDAKALGDILVVGVNSDASVSRLKGPERPIVEQNHRMEMLLGLKPVDYVCVFEEDTPLNLILEVDPAVLTKGGDWAKADIVGSVEVEAKGGEVYSLPFFDGNSTTGIVEKILASK